MHCIQTSWRQLDFPVLGQFIKSSLIECCNLRFLRSMKVLNLEGNRLTSFPRGIIVLELRTLKVTNNFIHHKLWKSTAPPQPQVSTIDIILLYVCILSIMKSAERVWACRRVSWFTFITTESYVNGSKSYLGFILSCYKAFLYMLVFSVS